MEYSNKIFSEALAQVIKERQIKLRSLGAKTNLNYSYFSKIIKKKKCPPVETIETISRALNIPPEYFIEYRIHKIKEILYNNPTIINEVLNFAYALDKEQKIKIAEDKETFKK